MKFAVQTSLLSRRWRHIWASLPTLNFDSNLFIPPETDDSDADYFVPKKKKKDGFIDFVDNVIILRDHCSDIQKLHLVSRRSEIDITSRLKTWVVAAVRGNVEEIYIDTYVSDTFRLPDCVFTCKSLTKLELKMHWRIIVPYSIDLPRLKSLNLDSVSIKDEKLANKLFSSCPVLESLIVKGWIEHVNLNVSSHKLKHLEIVNHHKQNDCTLTLNAPNLESFISFNLDCSLEALSSLVTADISVDDKDDKTPEIYVELPAGMKELYAQRMMKCLRALHNVKDLTLSTRLLEVISVAPQLLDSQPPQFCNLKCLKLRTRLSRDSIHSIAYLLKISPCFKSLFLVIEQCVAKPPFCEKPMLNSTNIGVYWGADLSSACMLHHLNFVEIKGVRACVHELAFLEILLKNAMVLEKVVLFSSSRYMSFGSNWLAEYAFQETVDRRLMMFRQKLLTFPRASSSMAIFFIKP